MQTVKIFDAAEILMLAAGVLFVVVLAFAF
jgi:hypothetical protein